MNFWSRRELLESLGTAALVPFMTAPSVLMADDERVVKNIFGRQQKQAEIQTVKEIAVDKIDCPSWPLKSLGAVTVQGNPEASGKTEFESSDRAITGGVWKCSPGIFDLTFTWDEMALLLEGDLIIEESAQQKVRVRAGDFFFVPRGAKTRWTVLKPLKKVFFSRESNTNAI